MSKLIDFNGVYQGRIVGRRWLSRSRQSPATEARNRRKFRLGRVVPFALLIFLGLAACTTADELSCPDQDPATYVAPDFSNTGKSDALRTLRMALIKDETERTALCGGHLKVQGFSSSTGATATLFAGRLEAEGATMPARRRHLDETLDPVIETIETRWDEVSAELPGDGSDILGQLDLMAEYFAQRPGAAHRGLLLTDGVQTTGVVVLNDADVTEAVAAELAARVPVPDLSGVQLTIAGIGRVAGEPPPSSYVSALKRFYTDVCVRTNAHCLVVTDLASD